MSVEPVVRFTLQGIVHFLLQVIRHGTDEEREALVELQPVGVGGILLIIICGVDEAVDVRLLLLVKLCLVCLAKQFRRVCHDAIDPAHRARIHEVYALGVCLMLLVGQRPVAEEPVLSACARPSVFHRKQSVGHVLFGIRKVALHVGIVPLQEPEVAILLISLPRSIRDEGTPEGSAAALPEGRTDVRHLAIVALRICIALQPVPVERIHVVLQLGSQD